MKIKAIFFLFWLSLGGLLWGQVVNPFEIQDRLGKEQPATDSAAVSGDSQRAGQDAPKPEIAVEATGQQGIQTPLGQNDNPFEIDRSGEKTGIKEKVVKPSPKEAKENLKDDKDVPLAKNPPSPSGNYLFWIILFGFIILAAVLSLDRWQLSRYFRAIFNYNLANSLMRESTGFQMILTALLYLLFLTSFSFYILLVIRHFGGEANIRLYLICLGGVTATYLVRHMALHIMHLFFPTLKEAIQFSFSVASFNVVLGITLLLPNLLLAYGTKPVALVGLIAGAVLTLGLYLLRSMRGLLISFNYLIDNTFHFFLYLCAFEIAPLLVMYKVLTDLV